MTAECQRGLSLSVQLLKKKNCPLWLTDNHGKFWPLQTLTIQSWYKLPLKNQWFLSFSQRQFKWISSPKSQLIFVVSYFSKEASWLDRNKRKLQIWEHLWRNLVSWWHHGMCCYYSVVVFVWWWLFKTTFHQPISNMELTRHFCKWLTFIRFISCLLAQRLTFHSNWMKNHIAKWYK